MQLNRDASALSLNNLEMQFKTTFTQVSPQFTDLEDKTGRNRESADSTAPFNQHVMKREVHRSDGSQRGLLPPPC